MTGCYDPWLALEAFPGWKVLRSDSMPRDIYGLTNWSTRRITLAKGMWPGEDRATLTHEVIHLERGNLRESLCRRAAQAESSLEEAVVELMTAARLIPSSLLPRLAAMVEQNGEDAVAKELNVDAFTVESGIRLAPVVSALADNNPATEPSLLAAVR